MKLKKDVFCQIQKEYEKTRRLAKNKVLNEKHVNQANYRFFPAAIHGPGVMYGLHAIRLHMQYNCCGRFFMSKSSQDEAQLFNNNIKMLQEKRKEFEGKRLTDFFGSFEIGRSTKEIVRALVLAEYAETYGTFTCGEVNASLIARLYMAFRDEKVQPKVQRIVLGHGCLPFSNHEIICITASNPNSPERKEPDTEEFVRFIKRLIKEHSIKKLADLSLNILLLDAWSSEGLIEYIKDIVVEKKNGKGSVLKSEVLQKHSLLGGDVQLVSDIDLGCVLPESVRKLCDEIIENMKYRDNYKEMRQKNDEARFQPRTFSNHSL